jgi:hypothetical protein
MTKGGGFESAGTALILCSDADACRVMIDSLQPLAIRAETCADAITAIRLLETRKFEAVVVDLLLGEEALLAMSQLRLSRTNRTAVSFAITADGAAEVSEGEPLSTFVLRRPLSSASVNQTLRAAYGLMVRERRRYFRCPIAVPASLTIRRTGELLCQTINVSEGGIALRSPTPLGSRLPFCVRFTLPEHTDQLFAETRVCWQQEGRIVGLEFQSLAAAQKAELQEWLALRLDETLPERVAALFRSINPSSV